MLRIGVNQFDPLSVRETVINPIEVSSLIQLRLQAFIIDHRLHTLLIRQGEFEQLQLQGNLPGFTIRSNAHAPLVNPCWQIALQVQFNPDGLILQRLNLKRETALPGLSVLRDKLHGFPTGGIFRRRWSVNFIDPSGRGRRRKVHVIFGEELNGSAYILRRINARCCVNDLRAPIFLFKFRQ